MPFKKPHHTSDPNFVTPSPDGNNYVIGPKGLNIVWGNDSRYWKISDDKAELIQVSWLEVSGVVLVPVKPEIKKYIVKFHVLVKEDGFGWKGTQVLVMAKVGKKGSYKYQEVTLRTGEATPTLELPITEVNATDAKDFQLHFGLYEVWSGKWKGGLEIHKAEVVAADH